MTNYFQNLISFIVDQNNYSSATKFLLIGTNIYTSTKPLISSIKNALLNAGYPESLIFIKIINNVNKQTLLQLVNIIQDQKFDKTIVLSEKIPGDVYFRAVLRKIATKYGTFSDLPFASEGLIRLSFQKDYFQIKNMLYPIFRRVRKLKKIQILSNKNTDLTIEFSSKYQWINSNGRIAKSGTEKDTANSGNLLPAEIYTYPSMVNGIFVADAFYLTAFQLPKYIKNPTGLRRTLQKNPIRITVSNSVITEIACQDSDLEEFIINEVFNKDKKYGPRIGEFAFPGILSQNREYYKYPVLLEKTKIHIAHGDGYSDKTGCDYNSPVHGDFGLDNAKIIDLENNKVIFNNRKYFI